MVGGLAAKASALLERHAGRRGFLVKSAMVGTAVVTDPVRLAFRPVSAYAAVCTCSGQGCACGSQCCDGYTEFCCTLIGENTCPAGTVLGGWWRADGSGFCSGPRYYLDCNVVPAAAGICSCGCTFDDCGLRKSCCTQFRYGQCHQEYPTLGAIMCRVVTCTPPWQLDATCTTTQAVDNSTRFHDAPCLHDAPSPPRAPVPYEEDDMPPAPAVCIDSEGRRWVFVRGTDAKLYAKVDLGNWQDLGGVLTTGPACEAGANGRIDVAVRGTDGATWVRSRQQGTWGGWVSLGGQS